MSHYKPQQRKVPATVLTTAGFIEATFHVTQRGALLEQLDTVEEFYSVTDASLAGVETRVDFLALGRDSLIFLVPRDEQGTLLTAPVHPQQTDRVFVLFEGGILSGNMEWREGVRLSDFVKRQDGFIALRDCQIVMGQLLAEAKQMRAVAEVVVHVNHIVGISEQAPI